MAVGEDVVGADGLTNRERFEMRREKKRQEAAARAAKAAAAREAAIAAARARAEQEAAAAAAAAASGGGMLSSPPPTPAPIPEPTAQEIAEFKRYQELLDRGVIDEQGNILKPDGINMTEIMRGDTPSWASPELLKNAYIHAFESKARGGQNFMDSGDYQNFLNAGYSLTEDQIKSIGGTPSSAGGLTFGGSSSVPSAPAAGSPAAGSPAAGSPAPEWTERESFKLGGATPFMDSYMRSREAAQKKGPVSSMFADMLPGE